MKLIDARRAVLDRVIDIGVNDPQHESWTAMARGYRLKLISGQLITSDLRMPLNLHHAASAVSDALALADKTLVKALARILARQTELASQPAYRAAVGEPTANWMAASHTELRRELLNSLTDKDTDNG